MRLVVMLAVGLLVRQAALPFGKRLARRPGRRIPALLSYAIAGTGAALTRSALAAWVNMSGVPLWIAFGAVWGVLAGLLLPFARRGEAPTRTRLAE
jgi:membrane associated rhomboid family serine protease